MRPEAIGDPTSGRRRCSSVATVARSTNPEEPMPKTPIGCVLLLIKIAVVVAVLAVGFFFARRWYDDSGKDQQTRIEQCQAEATDLAAKAACLTK